MKFAELTKLRSKSGIWGTPVRSASNDPLGRRNGGCPISRTFFVRDVGAKLRYRENPRGSICSLGAVDLHTAS
jgi:hypothetical protein